MTSAAFLASSSAATVLRPLADPDLSGFYSPTRLYQSGVVVDDVRGWIYFYGTMTHVKGVRTSGIFRTSLAGVIDYSWLPQNVKALRSVTIADNGDLLGLLEFNGTAGSATNSPYLDFVDVVRVSQATGMPTVTSYRLPVAQLGASFEYPIALALEGPWIYLSLRSRRVDASGQSIEQTHLKRFSIADQSIDTNWGQVYDGQAIILGFRAGGLYLTYFARSSIAQPKSRSVVERVVLASGAAPGWIASVEDALLPKVLIDSTGRAYLMFTRYSNSQSFLEIHRFTSTGAHDPTWLVERANGIFPSDGAIANAVLVNQRLVVITNGPPALPTPSVVSFDDAGNGRIVRNFSQDYNSSKAAPYPNALIVGAGKLLLIRSDYIELLTQETFETQAIYAGLSAGHATTPPTIKRQPDGTTTMVGSFSVWYEGLQFRNYIRYDASGIPDFNSRLGDTVDVAFTQLAGVSARGEGVLTGARNAQTGAASFYVTATVNTPARTLDIGGSPIVGAVGASAADSVWLYFVEAPSAALQFIRRASIATGARDANWEIRVARSVNDPFDYPEAMAVDAAGGIWLTHYQDLCFLGCFFSGLERFSIANPNAAPYRLLASDIGLAGFTSQPLMLNRTHAYTGRFRHQLSDNMARDATWETAQIPSFVDDRYAYFVTHRRVNDTLTETLVERASLTGNGAIDALWQRTIPGSAGLLSARTDNNGNFFAHVVGETSTVTSAAIYTDQNVTPTPQTVVEFYSPASNRYFITVRAAEQALLDQYPTVFQSTGMRFETLSAPFLGDPAQPTCRFYFGPERGGSNSHFYGTGQDCAIANTFKSFAYEGQDFGALRPDGGVCPAAYPVGVTRLFNNRVATNEGNHRYVVGTRVINAMHAAGWINEGVVFCAMRGTEAVN